MEKYQELLKLARETIKAKLDNKELKISESIKKKFSKKEACFITLTINGELRGCIGSLEARQELWKDVLENSLNAAFNDSRFNSLEEAELDKIKIEISVLSKPKKINYTTEKELEKKIKDKGVVLKKGWNSATYLPQVWEDLPSFQEFIGTLCVKAGLNQNAWKKMDLEIWIYDVEKISE